ncbi:MAG: aminodeoxychorismate synthase component I [Fibrobacterota bacterium]
MARLQEKIPEINRLGTAKTPFLLITDFTADHVLVYPLHELPDTLSISFPGFSHNVPALPAQKPHLTPTYISFQNYRPGFDLVQRNLHYGNSYLVNYTAETPVTTQGSLRDIFAAARAPYRVWLAGSFAFFSPEPFVRITKNTIAAYPMKGTIDAALPRARTRILADPKEAAEHATIVDLLRNDLSRTARNVRVRRYRYIDHLTTSRRNLLQVSSEITGSLPADWRAHLGDILAALLPAGSVSGAPKKETVRIIRDAETHTRGFYTGITALFDGTTVESCVNIRFIQQRQGRLYYKSGGGITARSTACSEYAEMKDKVYVPLD